jgi:hypothetical protein
MYSSLIATRDLKTNNLPSNFMLSNNIFNTVLFLCCLSTAVYVPPTEKMKCKEIEACFQHCGKEFTLKCDRSAMRRFFGIRGKCQCDANAAQIIDDKLAECTDSVKCDFYCREKGLIVDRCSFDEEPVEDDEEDTADNVLLVGDDPIDIGAAKKSKSRKSKKKKNKEEETPVGKCMCKAQ